LEFETVFTIKSEVMSNPSPRKILFIFIIFFSLFNSCKTSGPGIFGKKSPHEQYGDRLTNAGLRSTALGNSWFTVAEQSLSSPLSVTVPYRETGYFSADRPAAAGLRFNVLRGQKLSVTVERNPVRNFTMYIDLWKVNEGGSQPKHIAAADTSTYTIQHEVNESSQYILRLQPELLSSGEYTISITAGPSLAYPIKAPGKNHIKSFWGADRDGGVRKHEGIDMFASFGTPVVAAADGRITRVHETPIGGKVVWLRVKERDYTLYYAHLDSQLVSDGETVQTGDTLGLMGNTGNAQTTSPHLHFGVYTFNGPVDPLPFVNPVENTPDKITASISLVGKLARVNGNANMYEQPTTNSVAGMNVESGTLLSVEAATSNWYKVRLPNDRLGFIKNSLLKEADKPLRGLTIKKNLSLLDRTDSLAAKKTSIPAGETVDILGSFEGYYFIATRENATGWIVK
jgi:murein DD-endopeptidase MepM/ murein hydrolase activator NlpD/SH3-like domain-containing protein